MTENRRTRPERPETRGTADSASASDSKQQTERTEALHAPSPRPRPRRPPPPRPLQGSQQVHRRGRRLVQADGGARLKGKIAVLKRAEKFGFISPLTDGAFDEDAPPPKKLYFSFADCDCDPSRLREWQRVTYAPPAQGTDRASHIELDLVGSTPHLDETRFGHVGSILTNVRSHDSTNVERQSLAACDVTAATTFCVSLDAPSILLRPNGAVKCCLETTCRSRPSRVW